MQNNEHSPSDTTRAPGFKPKEFASVIQLSENTMHRLWKLAPWRIDPVSIEFPNNAFRFDGGYATVVRGLLGSSTGDIRDQVWESSSETRHNDEERAEGQEWQSDGERQWLKSVAVKKMRFKTPDGDEAVQVLSLTLREAEFLVKLSHPNIIELEGFVEDVSKKIIWLVFPWKENGTLKDFIASADWEIPERILLIYDVARGVEYLHGREPPICHGDLKSVNILVNSKCRAIITDFGSAHYSIVKHPNEEGEPAQHGSQHKAPVEATFCPSTNTITLTGVHYTTRWASPELLKTNEPSLASDIWALGWVGYEVMTGSVPFHNVQDTVVVMRVIGGDLPSISSDARMLLIQALCTLVRQCWSIDPSNRPTAEDCRKALTWMPMVIPNPVRTTDAADFVDRSAELLARLGQMHREQSDYPKALEYFAKAVGVYADNGDRKGKANALMLLANIHQLQGEYNQAFMLYYESIQISTEFGERGGRAAALLGLATVHQARYQYSQAFALYSEALQVWTDIGGMRGRATALYGLAGIHRLRKEYRQALALHSECLRIYTDIGDRLSRATALSSLAKAHLRRKEFTQAFQLYSECLRFWTDVGHRSGRASALRGLAQVHWHRGELTQAVALYSECLAIYTDLGAKKAISTTSWDLAMVHLMHRNYRQALTLFSKVLKLGSINDFYAIQQWRASWARIETKTTAVAQPIIRKNLPRPFKKLDSLWMQFTRRSMLPMSTGYSS